MIRHTRSGSGKAKFPLNLEVKYNNTATSNHQFSKKSPYSIKSYPNFCFILAILFPIASLSLLMWSLIVGWTQMVGNKQKPHLHNFYFLQTLSKDVAL